MDDYGLFQLFEDNRNHPDAEYLPKSFEEMTVFEKQCRVDGFDELADFIEDWRILIQFHREREWDAEPYSSTRK